MICLTLAWFTGLRYMWATDADAPGEEAVMEHQGQSGRFKDGEGDGDVDGDGDGERSPAGEVIFFHLISALTLALQTQRWNRFFEISWIMFIRLCSNVVVHHLLWQYFPQYCGFYTARTHPVFHGTFRKLKVRILQLGEIFSGKISGLYSATAACEIRQEGRWFVDKWTV